MNSPPLRVPSGGGLAPAGLPAPAENGTAKVRALRSPAERPSPPRDGWRSPVQTAVGGDASVPTVAHMGVRVSVVIAALNEAENLPYVLARLPDGLHEVIVVDGNSVDETVAVTRRHRPDARIVMQPGRGKGDALAAGFAVATGDIVVTLDGDGSTDGHEIPRFVAALCHGADFVKGSRFAQGGASSDITFTRRLGNRALNALVNLLYGTKYTDLCYGFNAFRARCLPYMRVDCDGFEVETLINVRVAKAGLVVHEVPSYERNRISGRSNLHAVRDGTRVLRTIARERMSATSRRWLSRSAFRSRFRGV
jgi:glycosyltransferase involved in cell wall biosynthesis